MGVVDKKTIIAFDDLIQTNLKCIDMIKEIYDQVSHTTGEDLYIVHGVMDNNGVHMWIEAILDDADQAVACAEYLNKTKTDLYTKFYASSNSWKVDTKDYIKILNKK